MSGWTAVYGRCGTTRSWVCASREEALGWLAARPGLAPVELVGPDGVVVLRGVELERAVGQAGGAR